MAYRPKRFRRRPHHFRFRPRGFSDPLGGPIWRWLLTFFGVGREERRQSYNVIALFLLCPATLLYAAFVSLTEGPATGLGTLIGGLMIGWGVLLLFRYIR